MKDISDTICALSTAPGRSGLAIVRISGSRAVSIIKGIFKAKTKFEAPPARSAILGRFVDPRDGAEIDEGILTYFKSPFSYTGEDLCEISLHGNPMLVSGLIESICFLGGRIAQPGEFTMRAFLNGKMDLTQAEAVNDIINASTRYQAQVAAQQRDGTLSKQIGPIKKLLVDVIVNLESAVEFEEQDIPLASRERLVGQLQETQSRLQRWIDSYRKGKIIRDGFSMALVGRPNVGKSSLFNALLAEDRSIVAEIPGTTRDLVSEFTSIGGIPVRLQDTAGIHNSAKSIEQLGIERSLQAIADADAIVLVVDTSVPITRADLELKERLDPFPCIVAMNKADIIACWSATEKSEFAAGKPWTEVSAKSGAGVENLRKVILEHTLGSAGLQSDGILVTNLRHWRSLEGAKDDLRCAVKALSDGLSEEFALSDLHRALQKLGGITGETGIEDLLGEIFSRFCIGK